VKKVLRSVLVPLISIGLVGLIWQLVVVGFHVQSYVAPKPLDAVNAVFSNWGILWPLVLGTIRETVYGFLVGAVLGVVLGVVMAKIEIIRRLVYPLLVLSQAVPIIALASPLVLILGFSVAPKIVIVAWIVFFPVTVNVVDGLTHVDQDLLNLARVYGASSWRTFTQIELPAVSTPLFSGLKIGATYAVGGAIIAELVGSTGSSLAYYQEHASSNLQTAAVYGTTLVMTVIGIGWFLLVAGLEILLTPWQRRTTARRRRVASPSGSH
jgi:ABC-type nitrate/sulfonate/bicarbonate transport system permease component